MLASIVAYIIGLVLISLVHTGNSTLVLIGLCLISLTVGARRLSYFTAMLVCQSVIWLAAPHALERLYSPAGHVQMSHWSWPEVMSVLMMAGTAVLSWLAIMALFIISVLLCRGSMKK